MIILPILLPSSKKSEQKYIFESEQSKHNFLEKWQASIDSLHNYHKSIADGSWHVVDEQVYDLVNNQHIGRCFLFFYASLVLLIVVLTLSLVAVALMEAFTTLNPFVYLIDRNLFPFICTVVFYIMGSLLFFGHKSKNNPDAHHKNNQYFLNKKGIGIALEELRALHCEIAKKANTINNSENIMELTHEHSDFAKHHQKHGDK